VAILVFMVVSAIVIAGIGSWLLMRSLVQTGVLAQFSAGRAQQRV
jgi:ABC-type thiamin/hydroxymethylpyrimidine transport system permease subunit